MASTSDLEDEEEKKQHEWRMHVGAENTRETERKATMLSSD